MIFFRLSSYTVSVWNWCDTYHLLVVCFVLVFWQMSGYLSKYFKTPCCITCTVQIRDFKIRDAMASRKWWLIKGPRLKRRRLHRKSKGKIAVWMQDNAAAKRSLSVWFFGIPFPEIAMASFKKVHEMLCLFLIEEIIDEEEFALLYEAYRPSKLLFLTCIWKVFTRK